MAQDTKGTSAIDLLEDALGNIRANAPDQFPARKYHDRAAAKVESALVLLRAPQAQAKGSKNGGKSPKPIGGDE